MVNRPEVVEYLFHGWKCDQTLNHDNTLVKNASCIYYIPGTERDQLLQPLEQRRIERTQMSN